MTSEDIKRLIRLHCKEALEGKIVGGDHILSTNDAHPRRLYLVAAPRSSGRRFHHFEVIIKRWSPKIGDL